MTLQDLIRRALRMRPERVVVGEVRGAEVVDLLPALNAGHESCCCETTNEMAVGQRSWQ